jgi:uncharacterized protein (DUF2141 family)
MLFQYCKVCCAALLAMAVPLACGAGAAAPASVETLPCHGAPTPYKLLVTSQGVKSNRGYLVVNLYGPDRRKWLADNGWLAVWQDPAIPGDETMCFYAPGPGRYALVTYHDANANGELDVGPLGPKEGYGFSNNVRPFLSAPSLNSVLFDVAGPETHVTIRLRYPRIP